MIDRLALLALFCAVAGWFFIRGELDKPIVFTETKWRGRTWYRLKYLRSDHWKKFRAKVLLLRGRRCEECGQEGKVDLHHLNYDRLGHERLSDVIILCRECHKGKHKGR